MLGLSFIRALISGLGGHHFFAPPAEGAPITQPLSTAAAHTTPEVPSTPSHDSFEALMDKMAQSSTAVRTEIKKPSKKPLTPQIPTTHAAKAEISALWQHLKTGDRIDASFALRVLALTRKAPTPDELDSQMEPFLALDKAVAETEIMDGKRLAPHAPEALILASAALRQLNTSKKTESLAHVKSLLQTIASQTNKHILRPASEKESAEQITQRVLFAARLGQLCLEHPTHGMFLKNAQRTFSSGLRELYRRGDTRAANAAFWAVRTALKTEGRVDFLNAFAHKIVTTSATGTQANDPLLGKDLLLQCLLANDPRTAGHPLLHSRLMQALDTSTASTSQKADTLLWLAKKSRHASLQGTPTLASFYRLANNLTQKLLTSAPAKADAAIMATTVTALNTFINLPHAGPTSHAQALRLAQQASAAYVAAGGQDKTLTSFALPAHMVSAPSRLFAYMAHKMAATGRLDIAQARPVQATRQHLHLLFESAAASLRRTVATTATAAQITASSVKLALAPQHQFEAA